MNASSIHQHGIVGDPDVGEAEVADGRDAFIAGDRELIRPATVEDVEAKKSLLRAKHIEIVHGDILDKRATAGTALDVDGKCSCANSLAVLDVDIANAAGGLAADADAGKGGIGKGAVGDSNVLCRTEYGICLRAALFKKFLRSADGFVMDCPFGSREILMDDYPASQIQGGAVVIKLARAQTVSASSAIPLGSGRRTARKGVLSLWEAQEASKAIIGAKEIGEGTATDSEQMKHLIPAIAQLSCSFPGWSGVEAPSTSLPGSNDDWRNL